MSLEDKHLEFWIKSSLSGVERTTRALGILVGDKPVCLERSEAALSDLSSMVSVLGGAERSTTGIWFDLNGEVSGGALVAFAAEEGRSFASVLTKRPVENALSILQVSALQEMSNILVSAYFSGMGDVLKKKVLPSVPWLFEDSSQRVMEEVATRLGSPSGARVTLQASWSTELEHSTRLHLWVWPRL